MDASIGPAAAVLDQEGNLRGSAFAIAPNLFLTTSYVVREKSDDEKPEYKIRSLNARGSISCRVVWRDNAKRDGLVLLRAEGVPKNEAIAEYDPVRFGQLVGGGVRGCEVTGFTREGREEVVALRLSGIIDLGLYPEAKTLRFQPSHNFQLQGFGGSGLCSDGCLIGIIVGWHREYGWLHAVPIAESLDSLRFREILQAELSRVPEMVRLTPPDVRVEDALSEVSETDPSDIQRVAATQLTISNLYYENVLAQAKRSFDAAVIAAVAGLVFFLAAIGFAIGTQQITASLISAVGGGMVEVVAGLNFWLYGRTSLQLNAFHVRLERMQRFLVANSVSAGLSGEHREAALIELVRVISSVDPSTTVQDTGQTGAP